MPDLSHPESSVERGTAAAAAAAAKGAKAKAAPAKPTTASSSLVLFYQYTSLSDDNICELEALNQKLAEDLSLHGRVLLAHEGINGTLGGTEDSLDSYIEHLSKWRRNGKEAVFANVDWKRSTSERRVGRNFPDFCVKRVSEIVSLGIRDLDVASGGVHLKPEEWRRVALETPREELVIVDCRNRYEYDIGRFDGAVDPGMKTTQQWKRFVDQAAEEGRFAGKTVLMCASREGGDVQEKRTLFPT